MSVFNAMKLERWGIVDRKFVALDVVELTDLRRALFLRCKNAILRACHFSKRNALRGV